MANILVLATVGSFVVHGTRNDHKTSMNALADSAAVNPVDGLTSYDIAANVAHMVDLPETKPIDNQAQSAHAVIAVSASDANIVAKPQIVATTPPKSKYDIRTHIVQAGDTVSSLSQKFGITTNSIKWSNNLAGDTVSLGSKLFIPPVDGIVYAVKSGDTAQTLATKFKASVDQIIDSNDAENGLNPGEQILIPNGQIVAPVYSSSRPSFYSASYGSNGYDYGYCTWYVATRVSMPSNWGNANTWASYALRSEGWTVSSTPRAGAIAQTSAGRFGHVAVVEQVSEDGSQIIYSDMNGIRGWGQAGRSDWVPASHFPHYIYR